MVPLMRNGIQHKANGNNLLKYATRLLSLLPITTLFQGFSFLSPINQAIVAASFIFLFILMFFAKYDKWQWFMLFAVGLLTIYNLGCTNLPFQNINMPIYLIYWVVMLIVAGQNMVVLSDLLAKDYLWYKKIIYIWSLVVLISIPFPSSYEKGGYFGSFAQNSFRLAPSALLIILFLIICAQNDNKKNRYRYIILSLVPLWSVLMGQSRTYLGITLLLYCIFLRIAFIKKSTFVFLITVGLCIFPFALQVTGIGKKVAITTGTNQYMDFWGTLTSGRSVFWSYDILRYSQFSVLNKLFGTNFNKIFEINGEIGPIIWAHNDFINILVTNGIAGLLIYLIVYIWHLRQYILLSKKRGNPLYIIFIMFGIWAINAFFNMVYTYTCALIVVALLPSVILNLRRKNV